MDAEADPRRLPRPHTTVQDTAVPWAVRGAGTGEFAAGIRGAVKGREFPPRRTTLDPNESRSSRVACRCTQGITRSPARDQEDASRRSRSAWKKWGGCFLEMTERQGEA